MLVIARPQTELFENEVIAVRNYLEQGGSAMVMVDPEIETGLEVLMSQWGVVPESTVVIDTSSGGQLAGLGPATPLVQDYGDHPITEAFGNGRSFYPLARPLQIREVDDTEVTPLLFTNQNSHAEVITEGEVIETDQKPEGPFAIGVALSRSVDDTDNTSAADEATEETTESESTEDTESVEEFLEDAIPADELVSEEANSDVEDAQSESRMVIIGNSTFATDGLFSRQLNGDVFLNSVTWLSKVDSPVLSIRPKEVTNRRLELTAQSSIFLTLLALIIFPLGGIISAGILWLQRR